jgi:hypothetical protein
MEATSSFEGLPKEVHILQNPPQTLPNKYVVQPTHK